MERKCIPYFEYCKFKASSFINFHTYHFGISKCHTLKKGNDYQLWQLFAKKKKSNLSFTEFPASFD